MVSELDSPPLTSTYVPSELDAASVLSSSLSAVTSAKGRPSSIASSLAPPRDHHSSARPSPMGVALQAVSQQHYGNSDDHSDSASQRNVRRLRSARSGMLPLLEVTTSQTSLSQELEQAKLAKDALDSAAAQPGDSLGGSQTTPVDVKTLHSEGSMQGNMSQEVSNQAVADDEHASEDKGVCRDEGSYRGQYEQEDKAAHEVGKASPAAEVGPTTGSVIATPQQGKETAT